jgi:branched-subunit amino acid transport protein AzlD
MFKFISTAYLIALVFGGILVILWTILPFAVFGIKSKLNKMIVEIQKTNEILAAIEAEPEPPPVERRVAE